MHTHTINSFYYIDGKESKKNADYMKINHVTRKYA